MSNVTEIKENGYQKIIRECRSIDAGSTENDLRNALQVILLIAQEEIDKEKELNTTNTDENV